jgi:hypothetical protein
MVVRLLLGTVFGLLVTSWAPAQTGTWQFRWQPGEVLTYEVEHVTSATEVVGKSKSDSQTKLNLTKQWQVLGVDAAGVATLRLALSALRLETTTPGGGKLLYDSTDAEKSDPHMREELQRFVSQPLALMRVDALGRVVEVKESKHGPASRFESELPFVIVLPEQAPKPGERWERGYKITVEPPQGTGERYEATQQYACKAVSDGLAKIGVATVLKNLPESVLDRVPLLQMQPEGHVVFDTRTGRLQSASLRIEKELAGHQGEGSSYRFQSSYSERYVAPK